MTISSFRTLARFYFLLFLCAICMNSQSSWAETDSGTKVKAEPFVRPAQGGPVMPRRGFVTCASCLSVYAVVGYEFARYQSAAQAEAHWLQQRDAAGARLKEKLQAFVPLMGVAANMSINLTVAAILDRLDRYVRETNNWEPKPNDVSYFKTVLQSQVILFGEMMLTMMLPNVGNNNAESIEKLAKTHLFQTIALTTIIGPFLEEMVFRYLPARLVGTNWTVGALSTAVFTVAHLGPQKEIPVTAFTGGLFFWYLMRKRGLDHSIIAHASQNSLSATMLALDLLFK